MIVTNSTKKALIADFTSPLPTDRFGAHIQRKMAVTL